MRLAKISLSTILLTASACPSLDDEVLIGGSAGDEAGTSSTDTDGGHGEPPPWEAVPSAKSFFVGESRDFSGGGACNNADLNDVTASLEQELDDHGWVGLRWVDGESWPEDFADSQLFPMVGLDQLYGDFSTLAVYAGHGNVGQWQWGTPSPAGTCILPLTSSMRLGTLAGDRATVLMSLTSCTGRADRLWSTIGANNRVRQVLAYHNSPVIWGNQPRDFLRATESSSDRTAWLLVMAAKPGVGNNSPSLLTLGLTPEDALDYHQSARLADLTGLSSPPEDAQGYALSYLDYGCGPCSCPAGLGTSPWLTLDEAAQQIGAQADLLPLSFERLAIARPKREPSELAERAGAVLELLGMSVPSPALLAWASDAVTVERGLHPLPPLPAPADGLGLFYTAADDDLLAVVERPGPGVKVEQEDAHDGFMQILAEAQVLGLVDDQTIDDPRVGRLVTEVGVQAAPSHSSVEAWQFTSFAEHAGFALLNSGMSVLVGSDGQPVAIRVFTGEVEASDTMSAVISANVLGQRWRDSLAASQTTKPDRVFIDSMRWAYFRDTSQKDGMIEPRLIVSYVLGYDDSGETMPSRQMILAISPLADATVAVPLP